MLLLLAALVLVWGLVARFGPWPPYVLPGPWRVAQAFARGLAEGTFLVGLSVTLRRLLLGYGLSVACGLAFGLLVGRVRQADEALGPLLLGFQTLPSICWLPLAILWFGLGETAILFVVVMGATLAIAIHTADGVKNIPRLYVRAAENLGASGLRLFVSVLLPAAFPAFLSGAKTGWSFAWRSLMAAEMIFVSLGLGQLLAAARELNDVAQVMAVMLLIVCVGVAVDWLVFQSLERRVRRAWGFISS